VQNNKKRVLIFHPALAPYRVDLFNELSNHFDLKVVFFQKNLQNQTFDQEYLTSLLTCDYSYLTEGIKIGKRYLRYGLRKEIEDFNPDYVISMEFSFSSILLSIIRKLALRPKWRLIIWTADNKYICADSSYPRKIARSFVTQCSDGLIVYSKTTKAWYENYGIQPAKIGICSNLPSEVRFLEKLSVSTSYIDKHMENFQLENQKILLYVGRLSKVKGLDLLIHSFKILAEKNKDLKLIIVGDGDQKNYLLSLAKELKLSEQIVFVGRFEGPELLVWYKIAHCFVLPSRFEPYGAVVNEALLAGTPVVCSKYAGSSDLIETSKNGYVIDPEDVENMAEAINKAIALKCPNMNCSSLMPVTFKSSVQSFIDTVKQSNGESKLAEDF
jgi:glycosyltransferase involved in cell wall biosynthesis